MRTPNYDTESDLLATTPNYIGEIARASDTQKLYEWNGVTWDEIVRKSDVLLTENDVHVDDAAKGFILNDRTTGDRYRLYMEGGILKQENLDA